MNAEQRALKRFKELVFWDAPPAELESLTVDDMKRSLIGCRILIGEQCRDIWTELRKPLDWLVGRVGGGKTDAHE